MNIDIGDLNKYYRIPDENELDWGYSDDTEYIMENNYGITFLGWLVAKDEYFDRLADSGLEWGALGQDEDGNTGLYLVAGDRVYDISDEVHQILDSSIYDEIEETEGDCNMKQYVKSSNFKRIVVLKNQYDEIIAELDYSNGYYFIPEGLLLDIGDVLRVEELETEVD